MSRKPKFLPNGVSYLIMSPKIKGLNNEVAEIYPYDMDLLKNRMSQCILNKSIKMRISSLTMKK